MAYESLIPKLSGPANNDEGKNIVPFTTIPDDDEKRIIEWLKNALAELQPGQQERAQTAQTNREFYANIQNVASSGRARISRDVEYKESLKRARVTCTQIFDLTEQWVSKLTRFAPAFAVNPPNNELNDRINAKLSREFLDYTMYVNEIEDTLEKLVRASRIDGESFLMIRWNQMKGDIDPAFAQAEELGMERVPLVDEDNQPILNGDGDQMYLDRRERVGDVDFELVTMDRMYLDPVDDGDYSKCQWGIIISTGKIDDQVAEFPELARTLNKNQSVVPNWSDNDISICEIIQKGNMQRDDGRYVKVVGDVIVENMTLKEKFGHREFPWVRLTNIDVPGELRGLSFFQNLLVLQVVLNNLVSIAYNNIARAAHVYWMVPAAASVDSSTLRGSPSIIRYAGSTPPSIQSFRALGPELMGFVEYVESKIRQISGIQPLSQGTPPAGIESQVALVFLEEQEDQRANSDIKKYNALLKKMARLVLATCGAFYDPSDGRTIRIVGKNNQFTTKSLKSAKLGGPYDIRVERSTALSQSKSGRLSQLLAIEARKPGVIPDKQFLQMMELSNDQEFYDIATVAVQKAEHENELMLEGNRVDEPAQWDEHITHWYTHFKYMQTATFATDVPPNVKELFMEHLLVHEREMVLKAQQNPAFSQKLLTTPELENFPVLYIPGAASTTQPPVSPTASPGSMQAASEQMPPPQPQPGGASPEPSEKPDALPKGENEQTGDVPVEER